jgi:hypothetical protein
VLQKFVPVRGAARTVRASVRKFLDWTETPRRHETREVTPADWGRLFPERSWVNVEAMELLKKSHPSIGCKGVVRIN